MNHALTIAHVLAAPGAGAFFFDDQAAIKAGAARDGAVYIRQAVTPGYRQVREASEAVSILLVLSDGYVAQGDCASVQYSGVGGREPRFDAARLAHQIEQDLAPHLIGLDVRGFRANAIALEARIARLFEHQRAVAYGISQALLDAAAHAAGHHLMARVIQQEWALDQPLQAVAIYGQCGEARYDNADKMILKQVPVLPHGLINTPALVGADGANLIAYVRWLRERIGQLRTRPDYVPVLHLDVYGMVGASVLGSIPRTADILQKLEAAAKPHDLRIEHPLDAGGRAEQIAALGQLRQLLKARGSRVALIADEWANTLADVRAFAAAGAADMIQIKTPDMGSLHNSVDAVLACHHHGVGAVLGGTCAETDASARATVHIGLATPVVQMLAKPGMGFDEGYQIVHNEMQRALRLDAHLRGTNGSAA